MKQSILAAVASIALPFSVTAGELLPYTYARVYCESRAMGMDNDAATKQAVAESYIRSGNGTPVTIHGVQTTSDVVASMREARKLCPQFS
jgi:hypothetical protein